MASTPQFPKAGIAEVIRCTKFPLSCIAGRCHVIVCMVTQMNNIGRSVYDMCELLERFPCLFGTYNVRDVVSCVLSKLE